MFTFVTDLYLHLGLGLSKKGLAQNKKTNGVNHCRLLYLPSH